MVLYGKISSNLALEGVKEVPTTQRVGLGWPIGKVFNQPYFNKSTSRDLVRSQVMQLMRTKKGERPMLPNYGMELENYLFDPLTSQLATYIASDVKKQMQLYAPNIEVVSLRVFQDDNVKGYGMPGISLSLTVMPKGDNQSLDVDIVI